MSLWCINRKHKYHQTKGYTEYFKSTTKQRVIALFLCLVFAGTTSLSSYQTVMAASLKGQKLPGALPTITSKQSLAIDGQRAANSQATNASISAEGLSGPQAKGSKSGSKRTEIVSKRTANSESFDIGGGQVEVRQYLNRVHYKPSGSNNWEKIDTTLITDTNAAESTNWFGEAIAWIKGKTQDLHTYKVKANDWQAKFAASDDPIGMVRIEADGKKISFSPRAAATSVVPVLSTTKEGIQLVTYKNLWKDTDVVYTVKNDQLKEEIILKSTTAATSFSYDVKGADLKKNKDGGFDVSGVKQGFSELSVSLQQSGPTSEKIVSQDYNGGVLSIKLDGQWLKKQSATEFPVVIDPTWGRTGNVGWNYTAYKSDGYVCSPSVCYMNAGTSLDNYKRWRTFFYVDFNVLRGKVLINASMHLQQANRTSLIGYNNNRYYWIAHASAANYNGIDGGAPQTVGLINYAGDIDMTNQLNFEIQRDDWGAWWMMWGEEWNGYTWKGFDADLSFVAFNYSTTPATPTVVMPQNDQTFTDPQVSFQVNPVGDVDGDPVQYYFRIATGADGETGTVINSGDLSSTQWTVPDGVLQDGTTYYLHAYSRDPYGYSAPSAPVKFKIDMRRGNDKTQSADTIGPVDVDLATGNVSTSISSHDTTALGGNLGVSLDYNSPLRSRNGLVGEYWNNTSLSGTPTVTRVDKNIDFNWNTESYVAGQSVDNFAARWTGYFVAPVTGTYQFGGSNDDGMTVRLGSAATQVYSQGCYSGICYGSSYSMTQGQVVPISVIFTEATGPAYARLYVKGAVAEQVVPSAWLQTGPRDVSQTTGLTGKYYYDDGTHNLDSTTKQIFLSRNEPTLSFNWGTGSPIPNGPVDFMSRWEGYINIPTNGNYQFSTWSDDGSRISIDGTRILDTWGSCCSEKYASVTSLGAGLHRIVVDHYDSGGPGAFYLYVQGVNGTALPHQIVPSSWLSPNAQILPSGWNLGIDPDGDLSYDHLVANTSSATLTDSSGDTHMYTWTGSGYKPPTNEDGQLTRNGDGTYTLIDTDGKTYVFAISGELTSVTVPTDDRKPAALRYEYSGTPAHIVKISDGVDPARNAQVYYYGDGKGKCASTTGFDSESWLTSNNKYYLCAVVTNDGRTTGFFYSQGNLVRVLKPGDEATDYQYDQYGRILAIRDSTANDVVAAGIRANDASVLTQLAYDDLGRATAVTSPAAMTGASRQQQTIDYLPYATPFVRYRKTVGTEDRWVTTGSAPTNYFPEPHVSASLLLQQLPGTHALYSCLVGGWDQMVSSDPNCEGQQKIGFLGYAYDTNQPNGLTVPVRRCVIGNDHFMSHSDNCEGFTVESILGYAIAGNAVYGQTKEHIVGDPEPNGYTRKIEWDSTFRTVRDTDVTAKETYQQWDSVKDLLLSTTDATGLKSTTIYNANDMPTDSYGPAPSAWFGTDRKPLAAYTSQVPHTTTAYDEGIKGLSVAWYDFKDTNGGTLSGAPKLHTTGFQPSNTGIVWLDTTAPPVTKSADAQGVGFTATGKLVVPTTGTYTIGVNNEDALRLSINDAVVIDRWSNRNHDVTPNSGQVYLVAGAYNRFRLDYGNADNGRIAFALDISGNGISTGIDWSSYLKPDYSLQTSQTVYGAPTSNGSTATLTSTTSYGSNPELGLATSATTDSTGLALTATSTYEAQGASGSYLRQTSSSLPGGATTTYTYYGATETRDNPCTPEVEAYRQGGMLKLKTEPDPGGAGAQTGRTTETIYDDTGKVVATRYNGDPWTCTSYDARERVTQTTVPVYNGQAARTVTNLYVVNGNPLITSSTDNEGTIQVETDLLGRNVRYVDAKGNTTTSEYDSHGHLTKRTSPLGVETFTYDDYDRLVSQKLDGITLATSTYDAYSRLTSVQYQTGLTLNLTRESTTTGLGRLTKRTYTTSTGQILSDEVVRAVTGDVVSGTELGQTKSYSYDTAGRLTAATVAGNTFTYGYGMQDSSCSNLAGANATAGKDSNRTSQTVNGVTTTYCYDQADRFIASSNPLYNTPVYDTHGNTVSLGSGASKTYFTYDSSDRNIGVTETNTTGSITTTYARDVQGRLKYRHHDTNGSNVSDDYYGYTASGDSPDFITDLNGTVTEKYFTLAGDVLLTVRPSHTSAGSQTLSLPDIHGDIMATIDADGSVLGTSQTGPFGEVLAASTTNTTPWNTLNGASFQYVGQHEKLSETAYAVAPIQMGARVYIPGLGRFLSVDPTPGGNLNAYVYGVDPVNEFDLDGNAINWRKIGSIAATIGGIAAAVACGASVVCGIAAGAVAAGAVYAAQNAGTKKFTAKGMATSVAIGGVTGAVGGIIKVSGSLGKAAMNSKVLGTASEKFANPSIANKFGNAVKSGAWNNKSSSIRTGWSVQAGKKTLPVFRTSIGYGKKAIHLNWKYGRFYK
jgi:RHS repeat-associated protein